MESDLLKDWEKFRLTEDEISIVGKDEGCEIENTSEEQLRLTLVGKLWTFFSEANKERILGGCPWFFDGKLLLLKSPSDIVFTKSPMWIRLYDVPFNKRNPSVMYETGEAMGGFIEMDESDPLGWSEFKCIKVAIDIQKQLRRGIFLADGNSKSRMKWVDIIYERLAGFCFFCGKLDHTDKEFMAKEASEVTNDIVVYHYRGQGSTNVKQAPIRLGPIGAARKLQFSSPMSNETHPKERVAKLMLETDPSNKKQVLRIQEIGSGEKVDVTNDDMGAVEMNIGEGLKGSSGGGWEVDKGGACVVGAKGDLVKPIVENIIVQGMGSGECSVRIKGDILAARVEYSESVGVTNGEGAKRKGIRDVGYGKDKIEYVMTVRFCLV
uniref:DUF4283 domain-containing protein n=1 Tax=Chenopodium quinoa TaxID=63459 RepID=A0A803LYF0_CHEQI